MLRPQILAFALTQTHMLTQFQLMSLPSQCTHYIHTQTHNDFPLPRTFVTIHSLSLFLFLTCKHTHINSHPVERAVHQINIMKNRLQKCHKFKNPTDKFTSHTGTEQFIFFFLLSVTHAHCTYKHNRHIKTVTKKFSN